MILKSKRTLYLCLLITVLSCSRYQDPATATPSSSIAIDSTNNSEKFLEQSPKIFYSLTGTTLLRQFKDVRTNPTEYIIDVSTASGTLWQKRVPYLLSNASVAEDGAIFGFTSSLSQEQKVHGTGGFLITVLFSSSGEMLMEERILKSVEWFGTFPSAIGCFCLGDRFVLRVSDNHVKKEGKHEQWWLYSIPDRRRVSSACTDSLLSQNAMFEKVSAIVPIVGSSLFAVKLRFIENLTSPSKFRFFVVDEHLRVIWEKLSYDTQEYLPTLLEDNADGYDISIQSAKTKEFTIDWKALEYKETYRVEKVEAAEEWSVQKID